MKFSYSFEDRGTDRRTESISERALKNHSNDIAMLDENNIPPPLH